MAGAGTVPRIAWPEEIGSTTKTIRYTDGSGSADADLAEQDTFWRVDTTAADAAKALEDALDTAATATGSGQTYTVTLSTAGVVSIVASAGTFQLEFAHVNTTASEAFFGFNAATRASTGVTLLGDYQVGNCWFPEQEYIDDSEDQPRYASVQRQLMNGRTRTTRFGEWTERFLAFDVLPSSKIFTAEEATTQEAFQRFYEWASQGKRFEFTRDWINTKAPDNVYVINDPQWLMQWPAVVAQNTVRLFDIDFPMLLYVA